MMQMMQMMQGIMSQPAPTARGPTPPLPTVTTRQPRAVERNPWAAPNQPQPQINHNICLHSAPGTNVSGASDQPPSSPGPPPVARVFHLPLAQLKGAVGRWVASQNRPSEHGSESDAGRPQLFLDGAGDGSPPLEYPASLASTVNSRHGHPLHKALRNLQKAIATMREGDAEYRASKGEKLIAYKTED